MGYLNNKLEQPAAETERSFGDKALLAGGTVGGAIGANYLVNEVGNWMLGSDKRVRNMIHVPNTTKASDSVLKKFMNRHVDNAVRANLYKDMMAQAASAEGMKAFEAARAAGHGNLRSTAKGVGAILRKTHKMMPTKYKVLGALGLPLMGLGAYDGYKTVDSYLNSRNSRNS